jgi:hypothetical protein
MLFKGVVRAGNSLKVCDLGTDDTQDGIRTRTLMCTGRVSHLSKGRL